MARRPVVLVTGAGGEIGHGLIHEIAERGTFDILALDVRAPGPEVARRCAAVRVGDILLKVNGQRLISVPHFQTTLYLAGIGNPVALEIHRNGQTLTREMIVEARPADAD